MVTYIALMTFTDQGMRGIKDTTRRAEAAAKMAKEFGAEIQSIHWVQGAYDLVLTLRGQDETSAAALSLAIASQGNVKIQTLRAFSAEEMNAVLAKLPR